MGTRLVGCAFGGGAFEGCPLLRRTLLRGPLGSGGPLHRRELGRALGGESLGSDALGRGAIGRCPLFRRCTLRRSTLGRGALFRGALGGRTGLRFDTLRGGSLRRSTRFFHRALGERALLGRRALGGGALCCGAFLGRTLRCSATFCLDAFGGGALR